MSAPLIRRGKFRLLLIATLVVGGCGDETTEPAAAASLHDATATPGVELDAETLAKWSRSCALCHVNGEGGAPRVGDHEAWSARVARGESQLLEHTVEGYRNMPPLGYCMDCERADLLALIRFMAARPAPGS